MDFDEGSLKKNDLPRRVECRSGSLAAPAGNLQLDTAAGQRPVVPTLIPMTAAGAATGPRLGEVCDHLILRGHRLAMEDLPKSCVHQRGHLGEVHRGERLRAPVLHQRRVGAVCSPQKPPVLQRGVMDGRRKPFGTDASLGGRSRPPVATSRTIDQWDVALASSTGESRACLLPLVPSLWQQECSGSRRPRPPTSHGSRSWSGSFLSSRRQVNSRIASSRGEVGQFDAAA